MTFAAGIVDVALPVHARDVLDEEAEFGFLWFFGIPLEIRDFGMSEF